MPSGQKFRNKIDNMLMVLCVKIAKIPKFAKVHQWKFILFFVSFSCFLGLGIPRIQIDQSLQAFFQKSAPVLINYQTFKRVFGSDEVQYILYQNSDPSKDIFDLELLKKLKLVEDKINRSRVKDNHPLNRIIRIRSILSANTLENKNDALRSKPFIGKKLPKTQAGVDLLREKAFKQKGLKGNYFSKDGKVGMIIINTNYGAKPKEKTKKKIIEKKIESKDTEDEEEDIEDEFDFGEDKPIVDVIPFSKRKVEELEKQNMMIYHPFITKLEKVLLDNGFKLDKQLSTYNSGTDNSNGHRATLLGNPWGMDFFMDILISELGLFILLCFGLILFTLFLSFGSLSTLVWPGLIIAFSILGTLGIIGWVGAPVTMMINIVAFLIVTIGVSTSIHIFAGYYQKLREGATKEEALEHAYYHSGLSIAFANFTTIVGMLSLTIVPVVPIANFGWFATIGVFFSFVSTLFLLPCLLNIWSSVPKNISSTSKRTRFNNSLRNGLLEMSEFGIKYKKSVLVVFFFLVVIALMGLPKIKIDTNFIKMIKPGNGMREAYALVDKYFGTTSNIHVVVDTAKINGVYKPELLKAMDKFQEKIISTYPKYVTRASSLVALAKDSHQKLTDGSEANYKISDNVKLSTQVLSLLESADPESRSLFVDDNWQIVRITLAGKSKGSNDYIEFVEDLNKEIKTYFDPLKEKFENLEVTITGSVPLSMELIHFVATSQFQSFFAALISICFVLIFIYGSVKFGLVALIPNLFPILSILGVAGHAGIAFDSDTLLVIPIAIGIVVDDTIHFLTHFRTKLLEGYTKKDAIISAAKDVGQAMSMTSFILTIGYCVFLFSIYVPFSNFGILSAVGIVTAFFSDMILLPAVLMIFNLFGEKNEQKS